MKIQNAEGLSHEMLMAEIQQGTRFIHFSYTYSFIFLTRKKDTSVFMFRKDERLRNKAWPFILFTAIFGWWGFRGPRETISSLKTNLRGGKDVTHEVSDTVAGFLLYLEAERKKAS